MAEIKEAVRLVENLYTAERVMLAMEKESRHYNTEYPRVWIFGALSVCRQGVLFIPLLYIMKKH